MTAERIRVKGLVQGVGFRPTVWRLARDAGLLGDVRNDGSGVLIRARPADPMDTGAIDRFCARLQAECPPLARTASLERAPLETLIEASSFLILHSDASEVHTGIVADAATCPTCAEEIRDPSNRRYRYPFTNCTHCGPRLSIVRGIPYDRARTSMSVFPMCPRCREEYQNPVDRRFHAQPNACPDCGPRVWLVDGQGRNQAPSATGDLDPIAAASRLLKQGCILAIKGIGGFHLACDATNAQAVGELRQRKRRFAKPFALMGRDLEVVRAYCQVSDQAAALLMSPAAPILLLERCDSSAGQARAIASDVAPAQRTLGFMLPYSPLHHLLLADWDCPLVMTSGNLSEEPQCTDNQDAVQRLGALADFSLLHERDIVNRVDDSVARLMAGAPRLLRRARGYAPAPLRLPSGFAKAPPILALGGELKNTFCLIRDGEAILSQHLGDLEDARTAREYQATLALYLGLFQHRPQILAVDLHPDYRSTLVGRDWAARDDLPLIEVQHHHAHLASTLADNGWELDADPVIGILLDGLGFGQDGTLWGCEFLLGDYRDYRRVGHLRPTPMPGGTQAILEPWRNLYAQLESSGDWEGLSARFADLASVRALVGKPIATLRTMLERRLNAPLSSSAGRLFDAVAAALGIDFERVTYEGQAAIELEALAHIGMDEETSGGYSLGMADGFTGLVLDPTPLWGALLADLEQGLARERIAARFHQGFATAIAEAGVQLSQAHGVGVIALSGGVFQNRILLELVSSSLERAGLRVLLQRQVPANDGGLSLGQACVAAARSLPRLKTMTPVMDQAII